MAYVTSNRSQPQACIERYAARLLDAGSTPATSTILGEPFANLAVLRDPVPRNLAGHALTAARQFCKLEAVGSIPTTGSIS